MLGAKRLTARHFQCLVNSVAIRNVADLTIPNYVFVLVLARFFGLATIGSPAGQASSSLLLNRLALRMTIGRWYRILIRLALRGSVETKANLPRSVILRARRVANKPAQRRVAKSSGPFVPEESGAVPHHSLHLE